MVRPDDSTCVMDCGPVRNLTVLFVKYRNDHKHRKNRFAGYSLLGDSGGATTRSTTSTGKLGIQFTLRSLLRIASSGLGRQTGSNNNRYLLPSTDSNSSGHEVMDVEMATLPPQWFDIQTEVGDYLTKIKERLTQLRSVQQKRLLKVFDDHSGSESLQDAELEAISSAINQLFRKCEIRLKDLVRNSPGEDPKMEECRKNAARALASRMQELSGEFKSMQGKFLKEVRQRQNVNLWDGEGDSEGRSKGVLDDAGFDDDQVLELEALELNATQRSKEIGKIAQSIIELNQIFKELAVLVIDQGTVLDRIDYNMEHAVDQTREANVQLSQAERAQRSSRVMKCILILAMFIFLNIIIIAYRSI
ncbi:Syntaxin-16 [Perkinsus chesapeaki]|uniref:Syntaxin-16 n=1 Tax=Perkinsus chesapeaki TaxID=330153 RepID=A0A7J6L4W5_PERCH|nr:Syntaxin-16 [Perkinsus chesapeaki]